jgi:hypothetical protein
VGARRACQLHVDRIPLARTTESDEPAALAITAEYLEMVVVEVQEPAPLPLNLQTTVAEHA